MPRQYDHTQDVAMRDGDTLSRLRSLFERLVDLPLAEREAWLQHDVTDADERAALARLLSAHDGIGFLDTPVVSHAGRLEVHDTVSAEGLIGSDIGGYHIISMLGRGGMSAVFLAERSGRDFKQQVAFKLLRRGLYSELEQRLFQRERQVLATLAHPNIARLIDGGVTDAGIPYLVMEYVDGMPITRYAQTHRLGLRQRLGLFLAACRAVDAAHHRLVVHRDIKPSNILVSVAGEVKLLDFGIAKLIEDDTDAPTVGVFTPGYAAPEQLAGGVITTATDVYGLGVLLHDLLVGRKPDTDALRRPSSLLGSRPGKDDGNATAVPMVRRMLRGDLDNILLKALAPEPARRYASAGAFAEDVQRYLDARPVRAHPPTRSYRTTKFIQRHRTGVIASGLFIIALLASLGLALWQAQVTQLQAQRANAMRDFILTAFEQAEPSSPRAGPPSIAEVVQQAIARTRQDTHMNAQARTELLTRLGEVLMAQGKVESARTVLQANYADARLAFGSSAPLTRAAGRAVMWNLVLGGQLNQARVLSDQLLAGTPASEIELHIRLLRDSATLATKQHDLKRAQAEGAEAVRLSRAAGRNDLLSESLGDYGNVQLSVADYPGAIASYIETQALQIARLGPHHLMVAATHAALARAYRRAGKLDDAHREVQASLAIDAAVLPPDDWRHALHLNSLMMIQIAQQDYAAALATALETQRINRIALGEDHPDTLSDLNNVGMIELKLQDHAAAVPLLGESLRRTEAKFGAAHYETAVCRVNYGYAAAMAGDTVLGEAALVRGIADLHALAEPEPGDEASAIEHLIRVRLDRGATAEAFSLLPQLADAGARIVPPDAAWTAKLALFRGLQARAANDSVQAAQAFESAALAAARITPPDAELRAEIGFQRAALAGADQPAAAGYLHDARIALAQVKIPAARLRRLAAAAQPGATPLATP